MDPISAIIDDETVWVPEIIWAEDTNGSLTSEQIAALDIKFCSILGTPKTEFTGNVPFYVKTNINRGMNILIGIHKEGESDYLWSWHLWATDYNPNAETPVNGQVHTYYHYAGNIYMMDRNLGATITGYNGSDPINSKTNPEIIGLYYQYGRKDPFQTQKESFDTIDGPISLANSVNNPQTFITGYISKLSNSERINKWYIAGKKSIYDPCPAGWKVPSRNAWNQFTSKSFIWDDDNKGRLYDDSSRTYSFGVRSWYPSTSTRTWQSSKKAVGYDETGCYWHTYETDDYPWDLTFRADEYKERGDVATLGMVIRCCKE